MVKVSFDPSCFIITGAVW